MYPNPRIAEFIESNFIPVEFHIKKHPTMWHRFSVSWTPAILVLAPDGKERYRLQGGSYALAVAAATGEAVARCVFVFLTDDGAVERDIDDLAAAVGDAEKVVTA